MDYRISFSDNYRYAVIKYFTDMTTALAVKSGPELVSFLIENELNRVLFDMRESTNTQSAVDNYFFANQGIKSFSYPRSMVTAFLVRPGDHSHDFITTAFQNAGYKVEKFSKLEDAEKWLDSDRL